MRRLGRRLGLRGGLGCEGCGDHICAIDERFALKLIHSYVSAGADEDPSAEKSFASTIDLTFEGTQFPPPDTL